MKIENVITNVTIPAAKKIGQRTESPLDKAMEALEIGSGFSYVTGAKDKHGNAILPTVKSQYGRIASSKWAAADREVRKTFKVFEAEDQSGVGELEVRFVIARTEFEEPVKRAKKGAAGDAAGGESVEA